MTLRPEHFLSPLQGMFGPEVSVAAQVIGTASIPLSKIEAAAMAKAVATRRAEFQAGRHAAKTALKQLAASHHSIPMGADRAPIWPAGFTGCISHSTGLALAAVAPISKCRALGLDLEPLAPLERDLWDTILTLEECSWLKSQPMDMQGLLAKAMFSIKECVYKAQYSITGTLLDFDVFTTTPNMEAGTFQAVFLRDIPPFQQGQIIHGSLTKIDQMLLTTCAL